MVIPWDQIATGLIGTIFGGGGDQGAPVQYAVQESTDYTPILLGGGILVFIVILMIVFLKPKR